MIVLSSLGLGKPCKKSKRSADIGGKGEVEVVNHEKGYISRLTKVCLS